MAELGWAAQQTRMVAATTYVVCLNLCSDAKHERLEQSTINVLTVILLTLDRNERRKKEMDRKLFLFLCSLPPYPSFSAHLLLHLPQLLGFHAHHNSSRLVKCIQPQVPSEI